jgi:hypothetical protein
MALAMDLCRGTVNEERMLDFKCKRNYNTDALLGPKWYSNFMERWNHVITRRRCKHKDTMRHSWSTHKKISNMYDAVYDAMVGAGVAIMTDEERMYDVN